MFKLGQYVRFNDLGRLKLGAADSFFNAWLHCDKLKIISMHKNVGGELVLYLRETKGKDWNFHHSYVTVIGERKRNLPDWF